MSDAFFGSIDLGVRGFTEVWDLQKHLVDLRADGRVSDLLLFVEHPPTYTIGRAGRVDHVLTDPEGLAAIGAELVETDRGGDVTFHGPGQVVVYPIIDLRRWKADVHAYLRALEQVVILALADMGVDGSREPGLTGVWHPLGKLAAIGVRVSRWITSHGLAVNVSTDLDYFKHIVPCGIVGRDVSSIETVLGKTVALAPVQDALRRSFGSVFSRGVKEVSEADVMAPFTAR